MNVLVDRIFSFLWLGMDIAFFEFAVGYEKSRTFAKKLLILFG